MKTAIVLSFSDLATDPRVHRQLAFLRDRFKVVAAGLGTRDIGGVDYIGLEHKRGGLERAWEAGKLAAGQFEKYYWGRKVIIDALRKLAGMEADLIVANEVDSLPLALSIRKGARIILDAHEYSPLEFEEDWRWRVFLKRYKEYLCARYVPLADAMLTVSNGIAQRYKAEYGITPHVMKNAPEYEEMVPCEDTGSDDKIRMIHHGAAIRGRQIELMIEMMEFLDNRFELNLMLIPSEPAYYRKLEKLARKRHGVKVLAPVSMSTIARAINRFDVGVYLLQPVSFNNLHALPNKFFDFIQARLAVVVSPSVEMARLVREHGLGIVAEDFTPSAMAVALRTLTREKIKLYKRRAHACARLLSAEPNKRLFLEVVDEVLRESKPLAATATDGHAVS